MFELPEKLPHPCVWLSLVEALTWVRLDCSVALIGLLSGELEDFGYSEEELRIMLEETWRELADWSTVGKLSIRGKPDGQRREVDLSIDDLRNCRHLVWNTLRSTAKSGWLGDDDEKGRRVARVERHPDSFEGAWDRLEDKSGRDFYDVVVARAELMALHPESKPSVRRHRQQVGAKATAKDWLAKNLDNTAPKTKIKSDFITEMRELFELPDRMANDVWRDVTDTRLEWRAGGRRPKTPTAKSPP